MGKGSVPGVKRGPYNKDRKKSYADGVRYFSDLVDLKDQIAEKMKRVDSWEWNKISTCCNDIAYWRNKSTGEIALTRTCCHNRFCPICNHVKSNMFASYLNQIYPDLKAENHFLLAVVFTIKNVSIDRFKYGITELLNAYKHFQREFRMYYPFLSYVRTLEFTYNKEDNTYHPHLHVLFDYGNIPDELRQELLEYDFGSFFAKRLPEDLCGWKSKFDSRYFYSDRMELQEYICKTSGCELASAAAMVKKSVMTDVSEYDNSRSTMFEFTKYITKFVDLLDIPDEDFYRIYMDLKNVSVRTTGGQFKRWKKDLKPIEGGRTWISRNTVRQDV